MSTLSFSDEEILSSHRVFSDNLIFYTELLTDIENARQYIYIEIYKFLGDAMGLKFKTALTKKCSQGVKVKLLIDSWGAGVDETFFKELTDCGGQVRFFKKFRFTFDAFTKHHRRNHRKIFLIDDQIGYLGSSNINDYSINWRELMVRMEGTLVSILKKAFNDSWKIYEKPIFKKKIQLRQINLGNFRIVRDIPSITKQKVKRKLEDMIKKSKKEIVIETPYFLPGFMLRKALTDAARRGVDVKVLTSLQSDVAMVDVLRSKYLGALYKNNINILFFRPNNLHAKLMMVDDEWFIFGSSNFDYRSFRYMFEIMLLGKHKGLCNDLKQHIEETLEFCEPFNYNKWLRRPLLHKIMAQILVPFRHYL